MSKPFFGTESRDGITTGTLRHYAIRIDSLSSNDFVKLPFGRQLDDLRLVKKFQESALSTHVNAKGIPVLKAVKAWIKMRKPTQFYAMWIADERFYKDDSVQIWFTE